MPYPADPLPRSNNKFSTFRSDGGKRKYISTTSRITTGDELTQRRQLAGFEWI